MPKRTSEEKIKPYKRKIKKLEKMKDYKRIIYSSDDSENSDNENTEAAVQQTIDLVNQNIVLDNIEENITDGTQDIAPVPELDPSILSALGESTEEKPRFGPKIHENLTRLWLPILRKGLDKEAKDKLVKEYPIPENCPLLQAPKLNPEVGAAINEGTRARDKRVEAVQQQLGQGITALNRGLELLIDDGNDRLLAIIFFSDSCRLLCDLHQIESTARQKFVSPGLDKSFLNIIQEVDRDEMLFGNKLSEKIKATKVIEKHGLQIKKPAPAMKTSTYQPSTSRTRQQGNWGGPPRFSSNRGGRGGQKKAAPMGRRAPSSNNPVQPKSSIQSKHRATGHQ